LFFRERESIEGRKRESGEQIEEGREEE